MKNLSFFGKKVRFYICCRIRSKRIPCYWVFRESTHYEKIITSYKILKSIVGGQKSICPDCRRAGYTEKKESKYS